MTAAPGPGIKLGLSIDPRKGAVVAIAGELDLATAPDLAAVLHALIDRGHRSIAIDSSRLDFIDARGVGVLAAARARILRAHGEISLHGVDDLTHRILEITGFLDLLPVEGPGPAHPELESNRALDPIIGQATRLAAESAHTDAVADVLTRSTTLIPWIIPSCDAVSVTVRRREHLITAASSSDTARELDDVQYRNHDGPCVEAATTGVQTHGRVLADEHRWRSFTVAARERGIESVLSSPLVVDGDTTGALNMYSRTPAAFLPIHQDVAGMFAEHTALLLHDPDAMPTAHEFDGRVHDALASREVIAQGQGVLMERLGVDASAAFLMLRRDSTEISTSLRRQAAYVVAETQQHAGAPESGGSADD